VVLPPVCRLLMTESFLTICDFSVSCGFLDQACDSLGPFFYLVFFGNALVQLEIVPLNRFNSWRVFSFFGAPSSDLAQFFFTHPPFKE